MADDVDTGSYDYADNQIQKLIDQLESDRTCSCCVARALMANGARLLAATMSPREAVESLRELADDMATKPRPGPTHQFSRSN
jgi:hypothetical protein